MRFLSPIPKLSLTLRQSEYDKPGKQGQLVRKGVTIQFNQHDVTEAEREFGLRHFAAALRKGLPLQENGTDPIDPSYRLSTFDTEEHEAAKHWTPEEREGFEKQLLEHFLHGRDYIHVEQPKLPAPWPGYDKIKDVKTLVAKVKELEFDVEDVVAYERQNQNREAVIEALQAVDAEDGSVLVNA